jgi:hypothetical protein
LSLIEKFIRGLKPHRNPAAKVVMTEWGPVSESVRLRVAQNMIEDPDCKLLVESALIKLCGGDYEKGMAEAKARYPEVYGVK